MAISSLRRYTSRFDLSQPAISLGVENSQIAMVLLSVISTENVQLFIEQSRCVVFNLWRLDVLIALVSLPIGVVLV